MPLTDAHLVLLSAASQREDGLLPRPDKLAGAVLARMEAALLRAGVAGAVPVRADQPRWRTNGAETPIGLHITAAGLAALGLDPPPGSVDDPSASEEAAASASEPNSRRSRARTPTGAPPAFRPGSKLALLVALLSRPEGAGIDALVTALAWQAHTVRAALTRLRQGGVPVGAGKDAHRRTVYRIVTASAQAADSDAQASSAAETAQAAGEAA